jgi:hypothetical protein
MAPPEYFDITKDAKDKIAEINKYLLESKL